MKIVIVRHGDPNYELDCLTDKGKTEAELLAKELSKYNFDCIYTSPLGRAKETASYTLEKLGKKAVVLPWLREFKGECIKPHNREIALKDYCWDFLPQDLASEPLFYNKDKWTEASVLRDTNVKDEWNFVIKGLDSLLCEWGYRRNGMLYDAVKPNNDTILLFCHLGVQAIIVSYLLGISPFVMLHGFAPAPSSVTVIATEERIQGIASFRVLSYGQTGHLYLNGKEASFAARFCECFENKDQRH